MKLRVAVIGCGPCGMSTLFQFANMPDKDRPEVVCYEKQSTWGGLWNYSWRIGTDEYGEPAHSGMYRHLWSNGPKEALEYPDYTFEDHFGKAIPSFPPRLVLRDYLEGRLKTSKMDVTRFIKFCTVVRRVEYQKDTDTFTVISKDLKTDKEEKQSFTHVIVATGIFSVPNEPSFPGLDEFQGRVEHAHDFKDAKVYKGERVLIIGASYSAEDLALQTLKFGAKKVTACYRTKPMGFHWPAGIDERPVVERFEGNTAYFRDGSSDDFDAVLLCTGYKKHYPFLPDDLRLTGPLSYYPDNLYKGTVWVKGGNRKLLYLGAQDQYYTFTMFDVQALWACQYITGMLNAPSLEEMQHDIQKWRKRVESLKDCHEEIDFQTDFVVELCKDVSYNENAGKAGALFHDWEHKKRENICTYRDQKYKSIFTGTASPAHHTTWMKAYDDTLNTYVNQTPNKTVS